MKCPNCGYEAKSDTANFCFKCGTKLNQEAVLQEVSKSLVKEEKPLSESADTEEIVEIVETASDLKTIDELPSEAIPKPSGNGSPTKKAKLEKNPEAEGNEVPLIFEFNTTVEEDEEEENPLAHGLPEWEIIPPNTTVRRKRKI
ncbi:zinc-ribbon domain-containing protein [Enterococcus sp. DIV0187]|uniref:zinc-ribbon domain-containing protein n=1 Tax=Enterococcus sp. DIV0187 TaxID=2774644 RepID=UPI003F2797FB